MNILIKMILKNAWIHKLIKLKHNGRLFWFVILLKIFFFNLKRGTSCHEAAPRLYLVSIGVFAPKRSFKSYSVRIRWETRIWRYWSSRYPLVERLRIRIRILTQWIRIRSPIYEFLWSWNFLNINIIFQSPF